MRERPLLRPEVGEPQGGVGVDDDPERDVGEVVPLGHHLRAHEQPGGRRGEPRQQRGHRVLRGRRVGVEPEHRHVERLDQLGLEPLGPRAVARDRGRAARVAAPGDPLAVAAVVAGDDVLGAVQHQRDVALRALPDLPARPAGEEVRPAAPVEQQDRLARAGEREPRLRVQRMPRPAHVEHADRGQRAAPDAVRQRRCRSEPTSPAAASPTRPRAAPPARRIRSPRRGARRSAGRPRACRTDRAPRRRRSARGRGPARRPPSAGRRRSGPRPCAAAATRRSARPRPSAECSSATVSPKRARNRPTVCGVSAISGTSTITPRPAPAPPPPRAGRPRSCPSP